MRAWASHTGLLHTREEGQMLVSMIDKHTQLEDTRRQSDGTTQKSPVTAEHGTAHAAT